MISYRDFTNDPRTYPVPEFQQFLARLHAAGQHWAPIVDSNLYTPDPTNASDVYEVYDRFAAGNALIRDGENGFYYGVNWPGFSVWPDWLVSQSHEQWNNSLSTWYQDVPFDGIWIDLSEASSFVVGSHPELLYQNPAHPPFKLPGEPGMIDYRYPEGFNVTNVTEAASASSASMSQSSSTAATATSFATPTQGRTEPTPGTRNLNFPPYAINNIFDGHSLRKNSISPNATHNDQYNTTEYEMHNLFGHQILNATYNSLVSIFPNRRPFLLGRSTFAGSGAYASHWG